MPMHVLVGFMKRRRHLQKKAQLLWLITLKNADFLQNGPWKAFDSEYVIIQAKQSYILLLLVFARVPYVTVSKIAVGHVIPVLKNPVIQKYLKT